jgi:hypothetical protein
MVALPGGTFTMGSPWNEGHRGSEEGPQRQVTIKPFAIGMYDMKSRSATGTRVLPTAGAMVTGPVTAARRTGIRSR